RGDKRVVEVAVVQRGRRRHHLVAARRLGQSEVPAVDAQTVGRRPFKKALGIDRAGQMVVQVGALGEGPQEGFELNLVGTDRVETVPYLLGVARRRTSGDRAEREQSEQPEKFQEPAPRRAGTTPTPPVGASLRQFSTTLHSVARIVTVIPNAMTIQPGLSPARSMKLACHTRSARTPVKIA